jgi:hypothetical protein
MNIDLLFLSRDLSPPRQDVWDAVQRQEGMTLRVIRITGPVRPGDRHVCETIARGRNEGKGLGSNNFVMLLDDDVVLDRHCVARLAEGLLRRPAFAALGADSTAVMEQGWDHWDYPRHVGMAAVLFRRERLEALTFRWENSDSKCECQCCCDDLRRAGYAIGYTPGALAWHRPIRRAASATCAGASPRRDQARQEPAPPEPGPASAVPCLPGRVLAAFDRNHRRLFARRFIRTLRAQGNDEIVTAVTYSLRPRERRSLARMPGVEVVAASNDGHPARRRLRDFQHVIATWPAETPVAYWDAGDVVFQDRIAQIWNLVRANPDRLLVVAEAIVFQEGNVNWWWVETIDDVHARARSLALLKGCRVFNGGFAAGTARAVLHYLKEADRLVNSPELFGSTDYGDQTVMNIYCHSNPQRCLEIGSGWNYTLCGRGPGDYRVHPDGQTERLDGEPLHVAHGAAGTLKRWDLAHLTA